MSETMLPMGDLGTHPMSIMPSTFLFDGYCHLRNDILQPNGPIDRPEPPRDEKRLRPTFEWMLAGLPWMCASQLAFVDRPVNLVLTGTGGGTWSDRARRRGRPAARAARARRPTRPRPSRPTRTTSSSGAPSAARGGTACRSTGDAAYAERVLDGIKII